jgi:hydroxymethylpyrimidine/phosphomethylpyrimidine kinase
LPVALTIAGSDSGGGAGIQADLKTFAALHVHGLSVVTCVTAQNPGRVFGVEACSPGMVRRQLDAVTNGFDIGAAKTGMLYSAEIIRVVARFFKDRQGTRAERLRLVVDPVMVSTSGARLLKPHSIELLCAELLPLAALVTPNLTEVEALVGETVLSVEDMRAAAKEIWRRFGCAVLVKGGHLRGVKEAADIFYDGQTELLLTAPFLRGVKTHGTGCTYAAAITAWLARGSSLAQAVQRAKQYVTQAIVHSQTAGGQEVLDWLGPRR